MNGRATLSRARTSSGSACVFGADAANGTTWTRSALRRVRRIRSSAVCRDGAITASAVRTARRSANRYILRHTAGNCAGYTRKATSCPGPAGLLHRRLHALDALGPNRGGVLRQWFDLQAVPGPKVDRCPVASPKRDAAPHAVQDLVIRVVVPCVRVAGGVAPPRGVK